MTTLKIAAAIAVILSITSNADAAKRHKHHYSPPLIFKIDKMQVYAFDANGNRADYGGTFTLSAKRHSHRRTSRGGKCDGFNGCRCGVTLANYLGLPLNYNGHNLKQAGAWPQAFPHTSLHVGAVMYRHGLGPTGHVSRVVAVNGGCSITVADEAGQHEDNACTRGATFMDVNGNTAYAAVDHSARSHRRQVAHFEPVDRFSVH